jgi:hypothetical protein
MGCLYYDVVSIRNLRGFRGCRMARSIALSEFSDRKSVSLDISSIFRKSWETVTVEIGWGHE